MSQLENQNPADTKVVLDGLRRLNGLLTDLTGKLLVKQKEDTIAAVRNLYETLGPHIYTETNNVFKPSVFYNVVFDLALEEVEANVTKVEKNYGVIRSDCINLFASVVKHITDESLISVVEAHDLPVLQGILRLLENGYVRQQPHLESTLSSLLCRLVSASGVSGFDADEVRRVWTTFWSLFNSSALNDVSVAGNCLKVLCTIFRGLDKTVLSLDAKAVQESSKAIFSVVKKKEWRSWNNTFTGALLDFMCALMDGWGLEYRESFIEEMFFVAENVMGRLSVEQSENESQIDHVWMFFDRLTSLAMPDCYNNSFTSDRIIDIATTCTQTLISDLIKKSLRDNFLIPTAKIPLFARFLVISELSGFSPSSNEFERSPKRKKEESPLEMFCDFDFGSSDRLRKSPRPLLLCSFLSVLKEIVASWHHRLGPHRLARVGERVFALNKKLAEPQLTPFCQFFTELIRSGAMGDSLQVKSEAATADPMQNPLVRVKALWKFALSAAHNPLGAEAAMELMVELILNFRQVLAGGSDHEKLVESVSTVLPTNLNSSTMKLLSTILCELEFDEKKPFAGAENRETGAEAWRFRYQVAEWLLSKVTRDSVCQLFQLCCYHPEAFGPITERRETTGIEKDIVLYGLSSTRPPPSVSQFPSLLGSCLIPEVLESVVHLLNDCWSQADLKHDRRFSFFTTIVVFADYVNKAATVTEDNSVTRMLDSLLLSVNEWLAENAYSFKAEDLTRIDPGPSSRCISPSAKAALLSRAGECPLLFARFPSEEPIPPHLFVPYVEESARLIRKYDDFKVSVEPPVKMESVSHHLSLNKAVSFKTFLGNQIVTFAETRIEYLPDLLLLFEKAGDICSEEHLTNLLNKALAIINEDADDQSEEETQLARISVAKAVVDAYRRSGRIFTKESIISFLSVADCARFADFLVFDAKRVLNLKTTPILMQRIVGRVLSTTELWPAHVALLSSVIQNNPLYQLCVDYVENFALHVEFHQMSLALMVQQSPICDPVLNRKIEALRSQDIVKLLSKSEVIPYSGFPSVLLVSYKHWPVVTKSFWLHFESNSNTMLAMLKGQVARHISLGLQERLVTFLGALCNGMPRLDEKYSTSLARVLHSSLTEIVASLPPIKAGSSLVESVLSVLEGLGTIEDHGLSLALVEKLPESVNEHHMIPEDLDEECTQCVQQFVQTGSVQHLSFLCTAKFWDLLIRVLNSEETDISTFGPLLFDRLLFFWEVLPSFRPQMTRVLHHFEESSSARVPRTKFSAEGSFNLMVALLKEFCTITILRSTDVSVVEAALNIISALNSDDSSSSVEKVSSEIPGAKAPGELALAVRLLNALLEKSDDPARKRMLTVIGTSLRVMPLLAHLISPYLCSLDPNSSTTLPQFIRENCAYIDPLNERRLIRTLCECVDGVGLGGLAMVECDGKEILTLGRLAVTAGFNQHAYALANLAFDRVLGSARQFASVGGVIPRDDQLERLLCDVYLATENSQALDSLPAYIQMDPRVQLLRATVTNQWLQVASSPVASLNQKAAARWYCGISGSGVRESRFVDALICGKLDEGYPKRLHTHAERVFVLVRNQNATAGVFEKEIVNKYVSEISSKDYICPESFRNLSEICVLNRKRMCSRRLQSLPLRTLCLLMWKVKRRCVLMAQNEPTQSSADYRECFEYGILLLLDKLLQQKAFPAALAVIEMAKHLVANHSFAQRLVLKECEIHVEMGDHQLAEHKLYEIANFINLSVASPDDSAVASEDQEIGVDVVCLLAKIQADYSPKDVELAIKTMRLLDSCGVDSVKSREFRFDLAVRQLFELEAYVESPLIKLRKEARDRHKDEMKALRQARFVSTSDHKRANLINKEHACEEKELSDLDQKLTDSVLFAIRTGFELLNSLCRPLKNTDPLPDELKKSVVRVLFPLIDMIFRYEHISEITMLLKNQMSRSFIPSVWLPSVPHIMPHCFRGGNLSFVIQDLIVKMIVAYPYHVLMAVLSYKYDSVKGDPDNLSQKAEVVDGLLSRAKRSSKDPLLSKALEDMEQAHEVYRAFVWKPIKNTEVHPDFQEYSNNGVVRYKMSRRIELFTKLDVLRRVPLPTTTQAVGQAFDYSRNGLIFWSEIHNICDKADGNSSPKILKVRGSNGVIYKMVWKDGESVRQDCLVQDLFSVMGGFLEHPLRTYNVVPLDSLSGIIEFCEGTQSLKDLLIGATSRAGLHHDIHPNEDIYTVRRQMSTLQDGGRRLLTEEQFKDALEKVSPVFRHHFYRNFPTVYDWCAMLQNYTKSLAQWSIVCYVVGLGDRHASNVLFEPQTSRFVHIDLGMILEFSKRILPIPELVPFRLTRDLMDPILIQGIRGNLAYEAADAMHKMRKHKEVILGVASVFLRETVSNFRDTAEDSQRSFASATAIGRLQAKLNGTDATISPVPPFDQALRLLAEATNLEKLSKLFHGWLAIL